MPPLWGLSAFYVLNALLRTFDRFLGINLDTGALLVCLSEASLGFRDDLAIRER
jgi:hypothetical protein